MEMVTTRFNLIVTLLCAFSFPARHEAAAQNGVSGTCIYRRSSGRLVTVPSFADVPGKYRKGAMCATTPYIAKPKEISLDPSSAKASFLSSFGDVTLRWSREVEDLLGGKSPRSAMAEAIRHAERAIASSSFPDVLRKVQAKWQVVFMGADLPQGQIPHYLLSSCHPGWMTPPANIYIASQRIAKGCSDDSPLKGKEVSNATLIRVLLHEMGHALEYQLLKERFAGDTGRAEGFAVWFEHFASKTVPGLSEAEMSAQRCALLCARPQGSLGIANFRGTPGDYAAASIYFEAIASTFGISAIFRVYDRMILEELDFNSAAMKEFTWTYSARQRAFAREVKRCSCPEPGDGQGNAG